MPDDFNSMDVHEWLDNKLRVELRLRSKKLKSLELENAYQLTPAKLWALYRQFIGELDMSEQIELNNDQMLKLPAKVLGTYMLWKQGHDLTELISKATRYRHRADLMEFGIDINIRCDRREDSNVVPMIRILEAKPAAIPAFFFERGMIHHSARRAS